MMVFSPLDVLHGMFQRFELGETSAIDLLSCQLNLGFPVFSDH
jgi:hypothetical protein